MKTLLIASILVAVFVGGVTWIIILARKTPLGKGKLTNEQRELNKLKGGLQ